MKLPKWILDRLLWRAGMTMFRKPDMVIGERDRPYLNRWWLIPRTRWFNVYLHTIHRDDDDRALHDHPWWNLSILLAGSYVEHTINAGGVHVRKLREAGDLVFRRARAAHRLEIARGPCWTLFITGPKLRSWGFHCPNGWVPWREFTDPTDSGRIGRGCGEQADG